ncbi:hypothetical protein FG386_000110 [Cryptosporidium ryanae]|uniref:uncharacterized protein n=1 Tax=Cryptosporidium ryanae TaxID=515981 RepID=UPI00351A1651|nr:hypothetical protein FG386_000110 [Cryptosporidium ryanae]
MDKGGRLKKKEQGLKYAVFASWLVLSLIVTIHSKWLMVNYFPYPITLSLVHMTTVSVLTYLVSLCKKEREVEIIEVNLSGVDKRWRNSNKESTVYDRKFSENKGILMFSLLVAINIWLSNSSLLIASISLHQIARTTIPLFTMGLGVLFFKHKYHLVQLPPVVLVIIGVAITVNSTPELSIYGVLVVFLSCCASSLKGIVAQKIQVENGRKIDSIKMLTYIGPIASLTLLILSISLGEVGKVIKLINGKTQGEYGVSESVITLSLSLAISGVLAFALNILSLKSSSIVTPLAMNIAGNVKQLIACTLGCVIFGNPFTDKLAVGILLTSIGAIWYSMGKRNEVSMKKAVYYKGRYIDRIGLDSKQNSSEFTASKSKKEENRNENWLINDTSNVRNCISSSKCETLGKDSIETECVDMEVNCTNNSYENEDEESENYYYSDNQNESEYEKEVKVIDLYVEYNNNNCSRDEIMGADLNSEIGIEDNQIDVAFDFEERSNGNNGMAKFVELYPGVQSELEELEIQVGDPEIGTEQRENANNNGKNINFKGENTADSLRYSFSDFNCSSYPFVNENRCVSNYKHTGNSLRHKH